MFPWTQSVQLIFISKWMSCVWPADTALYFLLQMCSMLIVVFFQTNDPVSFKWCISQKVFESEFSKGVKIAKKLNRKTLAFIFLKCQKLHFFNTFWNWPQRGERENHWSGCVKKNERWNVSKIEILFGQPEMDKKGIWIRYLNVS